MTATQPEASVKCRLHMAPEAAAYLKENPHLGLHVASVVTLAARTFNCNMDVLATKGIDETDVEEGDDPHEIIVLAISPVLDIEEIAAHMQTEAWLTASDDIYEKSGHRVGIMVLAHPDAKPPTRH